MEFSTVHFLYFPDRVCHIVFLKDKVSFIYLVSQDPLYRSQAETFPRFSPVPFPVKAFHDLPRCLSFKEFSVDPLHYLSFIRLNDRIITMIKHFITVYEQSDQLKTQYKIMDRIYF